MSGTAAFQQQAIGGLSLPTPKLRLRTRPSGLVAYTLFDGATMRIDAPVEVVLSELPASVFEPDDEVELRLFRYSKAKSASSRYPSPSRWAALPHIEGGGNAYAASQWLGSLPASGGADRLSRILLGGLSHGDVVDVTALAAYWLRFGNVTGQFASGRVVDKIIRSTWAPHAFYASPSRGVSKNVEPARFAVAFVARNKDTGYWDRVSGFSKFQIANTRPPFVWDAADPGNVSPTPGSAGNRIWTNNPGYDPERASARITDSENLAGWH
jgi:hypothetical protein